MTNQRVKVSDTKKKRRSHWSRATGSRPTEKGITGKLVKCGRGESEEGQERQMWTRKMTKTSREKSKRGGGRKQERKKTVIRRGNKRGSEGRKQTETEGNENDVKIKGRLPRCETEPGCEKERVN